jgi:hypothetical protein
MKINFPKSLIIASGIALVALTYSGSVFGQNNPPPTYNQPPPPAPDQSVNQTQPDQSVNQTLPDQSVNQTQPDQSNSQAPPPSQPVNQVPADQSNYQAPADQSNYQAPANQNVNNQSYNQPQTSQSYSQPPPPQQNYNQPPPNQAYNQPPPNVNYNQPPPPPQQYQDQGPAPITYQTYYNELSPYGQWVYSPEYGNVWVPSAGPDFQPYGTGGHWVLTIYGWTWVSDYPWGWATFHYGRWEFDGLMGWFWIPGYQWSPAWVSWRSSPGYYGWAPLGPTYVNGGYTTYSCPPQRYVFVSATYINNPNIGNYYEPRERYVGYYNQSTVVTNTYHDNTSNSTYYAGPPTTEVERYTGAPVRPVAVNNVSNPEKIGASGNQVSIFRPAVQQPSANDPVKPAPAQVFKPNEVTPIAKRTVLTQPNQQRVVPFKPETPVRPSNTQVAQPQRPQQEMPQKPPVQEQTKQPTQQQQPTLQHPVVQQQPVQEQHPVVQQQQPQQPPKQQQPVQQQKPPVQQAPAPTQQKQQLQQAPPRQQPAQQPKQQQQKPKQQKQQPKQPKQQYQGGNQKQKNQ